MLPRKRSASHSKTRAQSTTSPSVGARLDEILERVGRLEKRLGEVPYAYPSGSIESAMKIEDAPRESALMQHIRSNAAAREELIAEFGMLSSAEVAEFAESTAANRAALAHRWKNAGAIFSVPLRAEGFYPAFQFDPGTRKPRPVIQQILAILCPFYEGWPLALWFTGGHVYLGGKRPVDVLMRDPQRVVAAAQNERATMAEEFGDIDMDKPAKDRRHAASAL